MAQELIDLKISKNINSMDNETLEYIPESNKNVKINVFIGAGELSDNLSIELIWKAGEPDETLIWAISPGDNMPFRFEIPDNEVNGTNKLCLKCNNNSISSKFMSAYVSIEVNDL